jgi:VanZ family protein
MPISRCNCAGIRLFLGLALVIATWAALTPQPMALPELPMADKWAHLLTYLVLALLVDASWPDSGFGWRKWLFLLGYGLAIELIQSQIPNRFFSIGDLAANAGGIMVYSLLVLRVLRKAHIR